jgi:hypothetical protein
LTAIELEVSNKISNSVLTIVVARGASNICALSIHDPTPTTIPRTHCINVQQFVLFLFTYQYDPSALNVSNDAISLLLPVSPLKDW